MFEKFFFVLFYFSRFHISVYVRFELNESGGDIIIVLIVDMDDIIIRNPFFLCVLFICRVHQVRSH